MDFNAIVQAISAVGFPIVCVLLCFYYINKNNERNDATIEMNTKAIQELTIYIKEVLAKLLEDRENKDK